MRKPLGEKSASAGNQPRKRGIAYRRAWPDPHRHSGSVPGRLVGPEPAGMAIACVTTYGKGYAFPVETQDRLPAGGALCLC